MARVLACALAALVVVACSAGPAGPSPAPLQPAPAGTPVILFATDRVVRSVGWNGAELLPPDGVPQPTSTSGAGLPAVPSPDGSRILGGYDRLWQRASGASARPAPPANLRQVAWADDGVRLCGITFDAGGMSSVWVADPAGNWSRVAGAGAWVPDAGGPSIGACSWTGKRIAVDGGGGGNGEASEIWVLGWDGTVLLHAVSPSVKASPRIYTFSRDASIYAEYDEDGGDTVVRDLSGAVVASLPATFIETFSWTGRFALAMYSRSSLGTRPIHNSYLVEWRSGQVVWKSEPGSLLDTGVFGPVALQPDADAMALPLESTDCVNAARCNEVLEIVSPSAARGIRGPAYLRWFASWA